MALLDMMILPKSVKEHQYLQAKGAFNPYVPTVQTGVNPMQNPELFPTSDTPLGAGISVDPNTPFKMQPLEITAPRPSPFEQAAAAVKAAGSPQFSDFPPRGYNTEALAEYENMLKDLRSKATESGKAQQAGIERLRAMFTGQTGMPVQTDLSGLAALTEAWSGKPTKYQPPQTQQQINQLLNMQGQLVEMESSLGQRQLSNMAQVMQGEMGLAEFNYRKKLDQDKLAIERARYKSEMERDRDIKEYEWKSADFAGSMISSEEILNQYYNNPEAIKEITGVWTSFQKDKLPEFAKTQTQKAVAQAERAFVNSVLRRESGAAVTDTEFDNYVKDYFPRAGDDEMVIEQKRKRREQKIMGMRLQAGPAWARYRSEMTSLTGTEDANYKMGTQYNFKGGKYTYLGGPASSPLSWEKL